MDRMGFVFSGEAAKFRNNLYWNPRHGKRTIGFDFDFDFDFFYILEKR